MAVGRYFIAIVTPEPLFTEILKIKEHFRDTYNSQAALRSPPHITLHMPFQWEATEEESLINPIQEFSSVNPSFDVELKNYGAFPPRVIFIHVVPSPALQQLHDALQKFAKVRLGLFNADYKDVPYHPHLTVAFRDLRKKIFAESWQEFKDRPFDGKFAARRLTLLKHDGKRWNEHQHLSFAASAG